MKQDTTHSNNELDCLLIAPPFMYDDGNIYKFVRQADPPINLITLASWIRDKGFSVRIIDFNETGTQTENYTIKLKQAGSPRYIGISIYTAQAYSCYAFTKKCKQLFPNTVILAGGPHATFAYQEVLENSDVDIVVRGEGEVSLQMILEGKELSDIDGIAYKNDQGLLIVNSPRQVFPDINELPIPAYDLLRLEKYRPTLGSFKTLPSIILTTSRGCPGNCIFCTKTLGKSHRQKNAQKIFEEIKYIVENFRIFDFAFHDDTFTANKSILKEFCHLVIESKVKISWLCYSRIDLVDNEILSIMHDAGCHQIMYGVESFDKNILIALNKKINADIVSNVCELTHLHNITCKLTFIVGNPGDTKETLAYTLKNLLKIYADLIVVNIATPFPGTALFETELKKGNIPVINWANHTGAKPILINQNLSNEDIIKFYKSFYLRFYFRPVQFIRIFKRIRCYGGIKSVFLAGLSLVKLFMKR